MIIKVNGFAGLFNRIAASIFQCVYIQRRKGVSLPHTILLLLIRLTVNAVIGGTTTLREEVKGTLSLFPDFGDYWKLETDTVMDA